MSAAQSTASRASGSAKGRAKKAAAADENLPVGKKLNFAASEAYRMLRANLLFALPADRKCRIIGVTSANAGEGKSTTALNLAYMLAEDNKVVLLVESDMRLPSLSKRLRIKRSPGLSNLLAGLSTARDVVKPSGIEGNLLFLPAGDIPPNPSELLGSERMKTALEVFAQTADFIILDLPPVNEVSDALVASKLTDGIVMVVRQHYSSRRAVDDAMRQLEHADAKILGFVMTCADTQRKGSYKKYKKYYKYGSNYAYGAESQYAEVKPERMRKTVDQSKENSG